MIIIITADPTAIAIVTSVLSPNPESVFGGPASV